MKLGKKKNICYLRQCEIKVIKLYQVRTKLIALSWYWVTMIFLGQINPKIHCSPGMHNVKVIKFILQIRESVLKMHHFWLIYGAIFIDNLCLYSNFSQKKIACPYFTCISDFVCILAMRYCRPFMTSAHTLLGKRKKPKKFAIKLVTTKGKHFGISQIFACFMSGNG